MSNELRRYWDQAGNAPERLISNELRRYWDQAGNDPERLMLSWEGLHTPNVQVSDPNNSILGGATCPKCP